jgi:hypothetical protein
MLSAEIFVEFERRVFTLLEELKADVKSNTSILQMLQANVLSNSDIPQLPNELKLPVVNPREFQILDDKITDDEALERALVCDFN